MSRHLQEGVENTVVFFFCFFLVKVYCARKESFFTYSRYADRSGRNWQKSFFKIEDFVSLDDALER